MNVVTKTNSRVSILDTNNVMEGESLYIDQNPSEDLVNSIKENGLVHPIVVSKGDNEFYYIVDGNMRYKACKILGLTSVEAIVYNQMSTEDRTLLAIKLNRGHI